jgi:hypothetical protein
MPIYTQIFASTHDKYIEATTAKIVQGHVQSIQYIIFMASKLWRLEFLSPYYFFEFELSNYHLYMFVIINDIL